MNTGFARGGRGAGGRGGVGPIRGGTFGPGHSRKPYDKPMHAVQQPSLSGPIGAKDFATYPEPLIGKCLSIVLHVFYKTVTGWYNLPIKPTCSIHGNLQDVVRHCAVPLCYNNHFAAVSGWLTIWYTYLFNINLKIIVVN